MLLKYFGGDFYAAKKGGHLLQGIQMLHLMTAGGLEPLTGEPDSLTLVHMVLIFKQKTIFSIEAQV